MKKAKTKKTLVRKLLEANLLHNNKIKASDLKSAIKILSEKRASEFSRKQEEIRKEQKDTVQRWGKIAAKMMDICVKRLVDLNLKEIQQNLKPGQTSAFLDLSAYLEKYEKNIWKYIEYMIEKSKYAGLLPELKHHNLEIWQLAPGDPDTLNTATEHLYVTMTDYLNDSQGFDIDANFKNMPMSLPKVEIKWSNMPVISDAEWQKLWELIQIREYHGSIQSGLTGDLDEDEPGYNKEITDKAMEDFGVDNWRDAYKKALEYHEDKNEDYIIAITDWGKQHDIHVRYLDFYYLHETEIAKWCDPIILGAEPNKPFLKFDPPTEEWLREENYL